MRLRLNQGQVNFIDCRIGNASLLVNGEYVPVIPLFRVQFIEVLLRHDDCVVGVGFQKIGELFLKFVIVIP